MHFLKIQVRHSWFYEKLGSMLSIDFFTWIESVRACQVPSMFAQSVLSPSVVSDNVVFDGTFVVQPSQKLGGLPVATVRFPFPVGPQHIRPVRFYLLTVMLTVFKYERFFFKWTYCIYISRQCSHKVQWWNISVHRFPLDPFFHILVKTQRAMNCH